MFDYNIFITFSLPGFGVWPVLIHNQLRNSWMLNTFCDSFDDCKDIVLSAEGLISGSHGRECEDGCCLGSCAMCSGNLKTFQRCSDDGGS
jgi:hypothetical protein